MPITPVSSLGSFGAMRKKASSFDSNDSHGQLCAADPNIDFEQYLLSPSAKGMGNYSTAGAAPAATDPPSGAAAGAGDEDGPAAVTTAALLGGSLCVLICVSTWVCLGEMMQIFSSLEGPGKPPPPGPYFNAWVCHSGYMLFLPWPLLLSAWEGRLRATAREALGILPLAIVFAWWLIIVQYTWFVSLQHTSVSANTAIYQSMNAWAFMFSVWILKEKATWIKVAAVVVCLVGVVLVSVYKRTEHEAHEVKETVAGYIFTLVSTVCYALYEVMYKKALQSRPHMDSVRWAMLFCGLIGVGNFLTVWIPIPILHATGHEVFHAPSAEQTPTLAIIVVLEGTYNCVLLVGIQLVTPFFMTVGTVLTLPGSIAADVWLHGEYPPFMQIIGIMFIAVGFLVLLYAEFKHAGEPGNGSSDDSSDDEEEEDKQRRSSGSQVRHSSQYAAFVDSGADPLALPVGIVTQDDAAQ